MVVSRLPRTRLTFDHSRNACKREGLPRIYPVFLDADRGSDSLWLMGLILSKRPRRNRKSESVRRMVRETVLFPENLVWPVFVHDEPDDTDIPSMPGVQRLSLRSLLRACEDALKFGIPAIAIFPCIDPSLKDPSGSHSLSPDNLLFRAVREVRSRFPELTVVTDVALDPYTSHGHDGILNSDGLSVDNDASVALLAKLAVMEAQAGADFVAPSDMMDGRIGEIRKALDENGNAEVGVIAYSAKYASSLYGPFRDAVGSKAGPASICKATYQMDPANRDEAIREVLLDIEEGADIVMVKPASYYLDVIRDISEISEVPVAGYQVSGEFSQIHAAGRMGWLDYERKRDESLVAIKRAGARIIFTYFAREVAEGICRGRGCR